MWKSVVIAVGAAIAAAYSQILLKKGADKEYSQVVSRYLNKYVLSGYFLLGISTIFNIWAYVELDYMMGNIIGALSYVLVVVFSVFLLKEKLNQNKMIGISVVLLGIIIYNI